MTTKPAAEPSRELKPCPVCSVAQAETYARQNGLWTTSCENDDCKFTVTTIGGSKEESERRWNTRAPPAEPVAWTNKEQISFLKEPAYGEVPMAMWAKASKSVDIPLYASPSPIPDVPVGREEIIQQCADVVGNMRQSEAGLFDAKHSGQRGCDRADTLYDAYVAIRALKPQDGGETK